ncbi:MAG: ABC transporter ATP-binding protein/permease [Gorillibacterium sp.]|nr:ABC transporter ATP-binding protein/permease [Gorillibacterium sp.]
MRLITSFLKPYRKSIVFALLLMLMELVVELWHPLLMAKMINEGVVPKDMTVILRYGGLMVGISLMGFAAGIINSFYAAEISQGVGYKMRERLFERVESVSYAAFNRFPTSTLITRITNDVSQIQNIVFMSLRVMLRAPLMMVGGLIMALTINFKVALALLVVTPILVVSMIIVMKKGFLLFQRVQKQLDRTNSVMRETLGGMRWIRALVRSRHEVERFAEASGELKKKTVSATRWMELTIPLLLLIMNICVLFILWYGSIEVTTNGAEVGDIVAVVNYATRITGAFSILSWVLTSISRARASAVRISEVLDMELDPSELGFEGETEGDSEVDVRISKSASVGVATQVSKIDSNHSPSLDAPSVTSEDLQVKQTAAKLEFKDVSFRYPNTVIPVLNAISFTAEPGETVAILGATGSGKSSLFQLIPRLYEPDEGEILLDGVNIADMEPNVLREQIGYVPQEVKLFTGTVTDNLLWGKADATSEERLEATRHAQIHHSIMKLSDQYETVLGQNGVNLSGGQKQRLSIARALIRKPRILILDDSTSALDLLTEAKLLTALGTYGCTTLIITQKIATAMEADTILIVEDGSLIAEGTHATLMQSSKLYRQIVTSQFGEGSVLTYETAAE